MSESTPAAATVPASVLNGRNYRVRRLLVKLDLDVYTDAGQLETRGETNVIVINEIDFPPSLVEYLRTKTDMGRGFVTTAPAPTTEG